MGEAGRGGDCSTAAPAAAESVCRAPRDAEQSLPSAGVTAPGAPGAARSHGAGVLSENTNSGEHKHQHRS